MAGPLLRLDDRPLNKRELRAASEVARDAFYDDDFFKFLLPNDRRRYRGLMMLHRTVFGHLGAKSQLRTVRDEVDAVVGVAAWLTVAGYPQPVGLQLQMLPASIRAMGRVRSFTRGNAYLVAGAKVHPREPHWYLWVIAVSPALQRHGVGTMLMEDALVQVDREGVAACLETQNEANVAYYQRFGFELLATLRPVAEGPPLFSLRRSPR